jgi:hypothetical protein
MNFSCAEVSTICQVNSAIQISAMDDRVTLGKHNSLKFHLLFGGPCGN